MKKIDAKLAGKIKKILDEKDPKLDSEEVKSQISASGQLLFSYIEHWLKAADLAQDLKQEIQNVKKQK